MDILQNIQKKLEDAFAPDILRVTDESDKHRGHAGWIEGTSTHIRVEISAKYFGSLSRVAQHRAITKALEEEFEGGLHALAIEVVDN